MTTKILDFCEAYLEKLRTDEDIRENPMDWGDDYRDRICFKVGFTRNNMHYWGTFLGGTAFIMELDKEDLKYLFDKYSRKLQEELNTNIFQITEKYESTSHLEGP